MHSDELKAESPKQANLFQFCLHVIIITDFESFSTNNLVLYRIKEETKRY